MYTCPNCIRAEQPGATEDAVRVAPGERVTVLNAEGQMEWWHFACYQERGRGPV